MYCKENPHLSHPPIYSSHPSPPLLTQILKPCKRQLPTLFDSTLIHRDPPLHHPNLPPSPISSHLPTRPFQFPPLNNPPPLNPHPPHPLHIPKPNPPPLPLLPTPAKQIQPPQHIPRQPQCQSPLIRPRRPDPHIDEQRFEVSSAEKIRAVHVVRYDVLHAHGLRADGDIGLSFGEEFFDAAGREGGAEGDVEGCVCGGDGESGFAVVFGGARADRLVFVVL